MASLVGSLEKTSYLRDVVDYASHAGVPCAILSLDLGFHEGHFVHDGFWFLVHQLDRSLL